MNARDGIIQDLVDTGLTRNEALAYLTLVEEGGEDGLTGYEVAARSGIPRSAVYAVLRKLEGAEAAWASGDKPARYLAVPPVELARRMRREAEQRVDRLRHSLQHLPERAGAEPIWTVQRYDEVLARIESMIRGARRSIHLSLWRRELELLLPALVAVADRDLHRVLHCIDGLDGLDPRPPGFSCWSDGVADDPQKAAWSHKALVVIDRSEALMGGTEPDRDNHAVVTTNPTMVDVATNHIILDITLLAQRTGRDCGPDVSPMMRPHTVAWLLAGPLAALCVAAAALLPAPALAASAHRSFYDLPSSNGYGAIVLDLQRARAHHFRDHLFATEEPRFDGTGQELWSGGFPESVWTRDLLYDAYFGVAVDGVGSWLTSAAVDFDASGWAAPDGEAPDGGTNLVRMVQTAGDLRLTTYAWAPWGVERSAAALVLRVENLGSTPHPLSVFSLHNLHLGEGRPGPTEETGAENETLVLHPGGGIEERGFAGVVAIEPLRAPSARDAWWPGAAHGNPYELVAGGGDELEGRSGDLGFHTDSVSYLQWDGGVLQPGEADWFGLALAHHGDPFAYEALADELKGWVSGRDAAQVVSDERAAWRSFQAALDVPAGLTAEEEALYRHSAVVLRMAQVRESSAFLREHLTRDGEPRWSMFGALPGEVPHKGRGSVLASLPPGRWTYAWPRDSAYAIVGMAGAGMLDEARDALDFLLGAATDRYREYQELDGVPVEPYAISLCRHHGFGYEESDTLGDGDFNFEFDGAGLFLWALREYLRAGGDRGLLEARWDVVRDRVAGFLVALVQRGDLPAGQALIHPDSSIWETHWFGKERTWAYTAVTAARGLCDAAALADEVGDAASAATWRAAAEELRAGLAFGLTDDRLRLASNLEELRAADAAGVEAGYADGAVVEAVGMGLFDPAGGIAPATMAFLDEQLRTEDGPGYARNDDAWDDLGRSPWGGPYDEQEWVFIDLRAAVAQREIGGLAASDALIDWVTAQSTANFLAIGETYDPTTADYTNNAPMVGFGAGAYITALRHRAGEYEVEPACGAWAEEPEPAPGDDDDAADDDDASSDDDDAADDDDAGDDERPAVRIEGCSCGESGLQPMAAGLLLLVPGLRRRRSAG